MDREGWYRRDAGWRRAVCRATAPGANALRGRAALELWLYRMLSRVCSLIPLFALLALAQQSPTLRSESSIVILPTLVEDQEHHPIYGLTANQFIVEDDGVSESVSLNDSAQSEPVSVVAAIQTGRRASREFSRIKGLGAMLNPVLDEPGTRVAIVEFDHEVRLLGKFTDSGTALDELKQLQPGDGGAAILDAVKFAVALLAREPEGRARRLLLVSEMRDHGSHLASLDELVAAVGTGTRPPTY